MCSSLWKCWRLRKKNGPRSQLQVVTLQINNPTWIQDYLLPMLAQTADSLTIRKVDLKLHAQNLDGFSMVSTPVNCRNNWAWMIDLRFSYHYSNVLMIEMVTSLSFTIRRDLRPCAVDERSMCCIWVTRGFGCEVEKESLDATCRLWWFAPSRGMVVQARGQHASAWAGGEGEFLTSFQRFKPVVTWIAPPGYWTPMIWYGPGRSCWSLWSPSRVQRSPCTQLWNVMLEGPFRVGEQNLR